MNASTLVEILKSEVKPALGCTEPIAVALAAAKAARSVGGDIIDVTVRVDPNVYKNGMGVFVPKTNTPGLAIAAALGAVGGDPELELEVLSKATQEDIAKARVLVNEGAVKVSYIPDYVGLYIEAIILTSNGEAKAVIQGGHTNIVLVEVNGVVQYAADQQVQKKGGPHPEVINLKLAELRKLIDEIPFEEIKFLLDGVTMNKTIAEVGLKQRLGMGIGANFADLIEKGLLADDLSSRAKMLTAAGADARMSGWNLPVMSSAGSGNHGLTATLPVIAVAEQLQVSDEKLCRALAMSHMVTVFIKAFTGKLSALCGCGVAAATGASAGIAYLLGATDAQLDATIKNMAANLTGMICDGGKVGCAIKLATAASVAVETALLALNGVTVPTYNGIIGTTAEETIRNMGKVSSPGMLETDKTILQIMIDKAMTNSVA